MERRNEESSQKKSTPSLTSSSLIQNLKIFPTEDNSSTPISQLCTGKYSQYSGQFSLGLSHLPVLHQHIILYLLTNLLKFCCKMWLLHIFFLAFFLGLPLRCFSCCIHPAMREERSHSEKDAKGRFAFLSLRKFEHFLLSELQLTNTFCLKP